MTQKRINLVHTLLVGLLTVLLLGVIVYLYQDYQTRQLGDRADAAEWLRQHQRDYRLKTCIDNSLQPCEIDADAF